VHDKADPVRRDVKAVQDMEANLEHGPAALGSPAWRPASLLAFRFAFCYVALYIVSMVDVTVAILLAREPLP
jgi:hypothetical protein